MDTNREEILTLLHRDLDEDLDPDEARDLELLCREEPTVASERRELRALSRLLATDRLEARAGFEERVLAALPERPRWDRAQSRSRWLFPAAVALALFSGALLLLFLGDAGGETVPELLASVMEFFVSTLLAGAGLLGASWRGIGLALGELLEGPGWVAFGLGVLALDVLLLVLLRRSRSSAEVESRRDD